jgi:outer membrane protein assembly factor BamB
MTKGLSEGVSQRCGWLLFLFVAWLSCSVALAASRVRGFPVQLDDSAEDSSLIAFDIDADGQLEFVVGTHKKLHALEADGNPVAGFPIVPQASIATGLTVGNLGGSDARTAIFFGTADSQIVGLDGSGKSLPGFPKAVDSLLAGPPSLADLNGDRRPEIVFGTKKGKLYALSADGKTLAGYPAKVGTPVSTAVTVGKFKPDAKLVLLFGDEKGGLHAWTAPGKELAGFPVRAKYTVTSQPVLGDIDNDGSFEVIFGSKDFKIYAVKSDGSMAEGYPVTTGYRIYSTPALADVDNDGSVDIVTTGGDGKLYVHGKQGKLIKGFPVRAGKRLRASPVVGDVDQDGRVEIAVGTDKNRLVLYRNNGKAYPGFPVKMPDRVDVAPLLTDINKDGLIEVAAISRNGSLAVFRMIKKGKSDKALAWPAEGRDSQRTARTYPNPPSYLELKLSPEVPRTTDSLKLDYQFFDMDGDAEPKTIIRWYRNAKPVPGFEQARQVPASATSKHDSWHFTLQGEKSGRLFKSRPIKIVNTAPEPPQIKILPDPARTGDNLKLQISAQSKDVDADKVRYSITWLKDRLPVKGHKKATVWSKRTSAGQRWTVVVTPNDGEQTGQPARASIVVANTVPSAAKIHLEPARPTVTQDIKVVIDKAGTDPDKQSVSYHYQWSADGRALNLPTDTAVLPAGLAAKHQKISLLLTSFDGQSEGGQTQALAEIVNTPARAPKIQIVPPAPGTQDDLTIEIKKPADDPDHDALSYQVSWSRAGKPYKGAHARAHRLPASETKKGDKWIATVVPLDGESQGKSARAEVTIDNSPPQPPLVRAKIPRPHTTSDLIVQVVKPGFDPDGDPLSLEVVWYESTPGGKKKREIARAKDMFTLPAAKTKKNTRYLAQLTPSDGKQAGTLASQWFEVQNTAPGRCKLALKPARPTSGARLEAVVVQPSTDPDGDRIKMSYRWYRDDAPVKSGKQAHQIDGQLVKRGQHWTVVATPNDGQSDGPACTAEAKVVNSPPSPPQIKFEPVKPSTLDQLSCLISRPSKDPDGDKITLYTSWKVDGRTVPAGISSTSISKGMLKKGQRWQVSVTASDGELQSSKVEAEVIIANSPPGPPRVVIRPSVPLSSADLHCRLAGPTVDPDGDALTNEFEWFLVKRKKDKPVGKALHRGPVLPAKMTRKGQWWVCAARAKDDQAFGQQAFYRTRVANAAPSAPLVEIQPKDPKSDQAIRCVLKAGALDPDSDKIRYRFEWTKDGLKQPFAAQTDNVPARLTKKNDIWQCTVYASDGKQDSPRAESAEVVVQD